MGNRLTKKENLKKSHAEKHNPKSFIDVIILLAYGYVTILTPNLKSYDSNGPKFLAFALLNLLVWTYLIFKKNNYFSEYPFFQFFKTKIGLAYSLLILVALLSFVKAINVAESVVPFFKMFTTFTATWIIAIILLRDKNYLKYLAIGMGALLIFDSLRVFHETQQYIIGKISGIGSIKAGYSNKNILAAALFIKLVFGLWLFSFYTGWLKKFGLFAVFTGTIAILFMSARAFYLGLIFLSVAYIAFLLIRYFQTKGNQFLKDTAVYVISLIAAVVVFTAVQNTLYPGSQTVGNSQTVDINNSSVAERLATVTAEDGGGGRLKYWRFTAEMIKENPILGIGLGNWKINIVEKENTFDPDFQSFYKVHNDFLEITSESGIVAGLLYISLFVMVFLYFLILIFKKKPEKHVQLFFIPAFGMIAYIFDASFNFPHDRPEIQSLFALFLGMSVALSVLFKTENNNESSVINSDKGTKSISLSKWNKPVQFIMLGISIFAVYFLFLNFNMLKLQRIWKDERNLGKVFVNSDHFINNFPSIPVLGADGAEPVKMMIAKKLYTEKKYKDMLQFLHSGYPNPYDSKLEFFSGLAHLGLNNQDSALYYLGKGYHKKPFAYLYAKQYCAVLETNGKSEEAISVLDEYLTRDKKEKDAWLYSARMNFKAGNKQKTFDIIDSALVYFPGDSILMLIKNQINPSQ